MRLAYFITAVVVSQLRNVILATVHLQHGIHQHSTSNTLLNTLKAITQTSITSYQHHHPRAIPLPPLSEEGTITTMSGWRRPTIRHKVTYLAVCHILICSGEPTAHKLDAIFKYTLPLYRFRHCIEPIQLVLTSIPPGLFTLLKGHQERANRGSRQGGEVRSTSNNRHCSSPRGMLSQEPVHVETVQDDLRAKGRE